MKDPAFIRDPASIGDPASIRENTVINIIDLLSMDNHPTMSKSIPCLAHVKSLALVAD